MHLIINLIKKIDNKFLFNILRKFYNYIIYINALFTLKNYPDILNSYFNYNNELDRLCDKYGSDKGFHNLKHRKLYLNRNPHNYTQLYNSLFAHCKDNVKLVLECGIGTNNPNIASTMGIEYRPGASLFVWRDYFKNAHIFGCDIDKDILFSEERITTNFVDQLNPKSIEQMFLKINKNEFDIIIDDGLHSYQAAINFFTISFNYLREGGVYIIEDVGQNYLYHLLIYLKNYNLEVYNFKSNRVKLLKDSNVVIIRKTN